MSRLDMRFRTGADVRAIDAKEFFESELPSLISARGNLAIDGAKEFDLDSITFILPTASWTIKRVGDKFVVESGQDSDTAVQIDAENFADFVNDLTTIQMLLSLGKAHLARGDKAAAIGWGVVIRSLLDNRAMYTSGSVGFIDRDGGPLDLNRSFTPDDDDAEIAHFLAEAGFLHLSGWLDEGLMQAISEDIDRVLPTCTPTDGSWWATLEDGTRRAVRVVDFAKHSKATREVLSGDPYLRIGRLTGDAYLPSEYVEALHKPFHVAAGISNIGWHNDCGRGMHSYNCCDIVVGICVTAAGPGSAQLGVLPGSHRALMPTDRIYPHTGFEPRLLTVGVGDMTVHCSCTMHMAKAPTQQERKLLYTSFGLAKTDDRIALEERRVNEARADAQNLAGKGLLNSMAETG